MKIKGSNIFMIRGDTEVIKVTLTSDDGTAYPFVVGDIVKFSVKKNISDITYILQKTVSVFDENVASIQLDATDTKTLDFGAYFYDIQVTFANGDVKTIIPKSQLWLLEEVS